MQTAIFQYKSLKPDALREIYITLNGKPYNKGYINHKDISDGGKLVFHMGPKPAIWY